jgi:5-methylcytosine-specific restriction endonuclease McrA
VSDWWSRNKHRYPADWVDISKRCKDATGWTCEACGAPHGPPPHILTVHHLDHNPPNVEDDNLLTCCQRCHLRLGPRIYSKADAIVYLRRRLELESAQQALDLEEH